MMPTPPALADARGTNSLLEDTIMLPSEYDLRMVEQRYMDLRAEAAAYRLAQTNEPAAADCPSPLCRLAALIHIPGFGQAHKGAMQPAA